MTLPWWWRCADCGSLTDEPHTGPYGEDLCPECCELCTSGQMWAWQDQQAKEERTSMNPGDPVVGHGIPDREQMAAAETGRP